MSFWGRKLLFSHNWKSRISFWWDGGWCFILPQTMFYTLLKHVLFPLSKGQHQQVLQFEYFLCKTLTCLFAIIASSCFLITWRKVKGSSKYGVFHKFDQTKWHVWVLILIGLLDFIFPTYSHHIIIQFSFLLFCCECRWFHILLNYFWESVVFKLSLKVQYINPRQNLKR